MSTIRQHVSNIRTLIRKVSNDSNYEDQFLYSLLRITANKLQYQHKGTQFDYATFCIPLVKANSHNCDCVSVGCTVLKSEYEIPKPLIKPNSGGMSSFSVETLGDKLIDKASPQAQITNLLDDIKKNELTYWIRSGKLIIWNSDLNLKAVQVTALWEDITDWQGLDLCDNEGNPLPSCSDILDNEFSLDGHLTYDMYSMVLNMLRLPLSLLEDGSVNENPDI